MHLHPKWQRSLIKATYYNFSQMSVCAFYSFPVSD
ncbi:hypothetical protein MMF16_00025735 [Enterobacter hormaechei]